MKEKVREDILNVLRNSLMAIKKRDLMKLRDQSDKTIHNSSVFQDKYSISTAVVIYSTYKLFEKNKFRSDPKWNDFEKLLVSELQDSVKLVNGNDLGGYLSSLRKITKSMTKLEKNIGQFVQHIVHVTKIKKATRIQQHGISIQRVAKLLDIPSWEIMSYVGHTKTFDNSLNLSKSIGDRLEIAKKIFGVK